MVFTALGEETRKMRLPVAHTHTEKTQRRVETIEVHHSQQRSGSSETTGSFMVSWFVFFGQITVCGNTPSHSLSASDSLTLSLPVSLCALLVSSERRKLVCARTGASPGSNISPNTTAGKRAAACRRASHWVDYARYRNVQPSSREKVWGSLGRT